MGNKSCELGHQAQRELLSFKKTAFCWWTAYPEIGDKSWRVRERHRQATQRERWRDFQSWTEVRRGTCLNSRLSRLRQKQQRSLEYSRREGRWESTAVGDRSESSS